MDNKTVAEELRELKQSVDLLIKFQHHQPRRHYLPRLRPIAINDSQNLSNYSEQERILRCKLASVYRLVEYYGWTMSIYNHITVKASDEHDHFLINPFGLLYDEITASSLIKVDIDGKILDKGSTKFGFNKAGYVLHSAIHQARPDLKAVIHIHHPACVAVSASKQGLMLTSQEASVVGHISYHDYQGILIDEKERRDIVKNLGPVNKVMILRNHGLMVAGGSLEEAVAMLDQLVLACEAQVRMTVEHTILLDNSILDQVQAVMRMAGQALQGLDDDQPKPNIFDVEFEARMRMLDDAGLCTGYPYRFQPPTLATKAAKHCHENKHCHQKNH